MKMSLFGGLLLALVSCSPEPVADLLLPAEIESGLNMVLADTGSFADAAVSRVVGKHYLPGEDRWRIIACFQFTDAAGNQAEECNDSFLLYQLDSGPWIVSVNRNGVYRWREMVSPFESGNVASDPMPSDSDSAND